MKITCEYCGGLYDDTLTHCPNCGGVNNNVRRSTIDQPTTIEELQKWYEDRGLPPYETTRFFVGENYQGARAFGIYKDGDNFVVYKNKDDGSRAIRYEGTDEAYAVNELFQRLKQEIVEQKANRVASNEPIEQVNSGNTGGMGQPGANGGKRNGKLRLYLTLIVLGYALTSIVSGLYGLYTARNRVKDGYYVYQNVTYYHDTYNNNSYWYEYDDSSDSWNSVVKSSLPEDLQSKKSSKDFYDTDKWDSSSQYSDFSTVKNEFHSQYNNTTSYSNDSWDNSDSSSYDWGSDDSWDSGSTDWGSDW